MRRDQRWFEFRDMRSRKMDRDAWIALRATKSVDNGAKRFECGHEEEYVGVSSAAVPVSQRQLAESTVNWGSLNLMYDHAPQVEHGIYHPSYEFKPAIENLEGTFLVLDQRGNSTDPGDWLIHPDLILGLQLKREGDVWVAMDEGYIPVIRLSRDSRGAPDLLEIRATHLKDFLAARNECLCLSTYRSRELILKDAPEITWKEDPTRENAPSERWEGRVVEITEEGHQFGSEMAILHVGRKNFDLDQDVPEIGVDDDFETSGFTRRFEGNKLFRVLGELWKVYFVEPGQQSPRVRGDDVSSSTFFYTDAAGNKESAEALDRMGHWLWFSPDVINKALEYRGSSLEWYTRDTGRIRMGPSVGIVFGVNQLGLVNVYAKDIRYSSAWHQQVWAGFNVYPEGGVSRELLMAQAEGEPAATQAPEAFLQEGIELVNQSSLEAFGFKLIRPHPEHQNLIRLCHRFRAVQEGGLYRLAKDLSSTQR